MRLDRRTFLGAAGLSALQAKTAPAEAESVWVNDVHAQLTRTRVHEVVAPKSTEDLARALASASRAGRGVSICGGRHAMGAQAFGTDTMLIDTRGLSRVIELDAEAGLVNAEAGIQWPALIRELNEAQRDRPREWGILQKQTGADRLTLGGALAANIHGRALSLAPFVGDLESFDLIDAGGRFRRCSRSSEPELFGLAVGGYGLFGVVTSVTLRLAPRRKLTRVVEMGTTGELGERVETRIAEGFLYGDLQFAIDPASDDFLRKGVFSCYRPAERTAPMPEGQKELSGEDWGRLLSLAHTDRTRAFEEYARHYLATSGQVYWSDTHQLSYYLDGYHSTLDPKGGPPATEMITEVYVPRPKLEDFLTEVRPAFRKNGVGIVYGTMRFIEKDEETFLPWARERYVCMVVNLHVPHTEDGHKRTGDAFRDLIDMALARGGSYYLTYHRHARRDQVLAAYPQLPEFLRAKRRYDPDERFQSDWYRHYRAMFA
jgi:FAD/FMN-containing dehydrogenase